MKWAQALDALDRAVSYLARRKELSCLTVASLVICARLTVLPILPIPTPRIADEFSYVLAGETFAAGRLATPTHPLWRFFDTIHENMQPTYASKYPPGQGLFLALGIVTLGKAWYGVLISVALMCGCLCWMLQGWVAPRLALYGGILAALTFGLVHYWVNSYWGGAVAATGGALVLGAVPRLWKSPSVGIALVAGLGVLILANTRPYEGGVLVLLSAGLFVWRRPKRLPYFKIFVPTVLILVSGVVAMGYYNWRVTGDPLQLAYRINQQRNARVPVLWVLPPGEVPALQYRDAAVRGIWDWDAALYWSRKRNPERLLLKLAEVDLTELLGWPGITLSVLFFAGVTAMAVSSKARALVVTSLLFSGALVLNKYIFSHYAAPGLGLILIVAMMGARVLGTVRIRGVRFGWPLALSGLALSLVALIGPLERQFKSSSDDPVKAVTDLDFRYEVKAKLEATPGQHVVMVRYSAQHSPHTEHVFNSPNIDAQKVVWAFDFGPESDVPLFEYFKGRSFWLMQPDGPKATLEPYPGLRQ